MIGAEYALEELPSLSFSRYMRLKRCLSGGAARSRTGSSGIIRPTQLRAQVLGDILHRAMSAINSTPKDELSPSMFRARFNALVAEMHARIIANPSSRHLGDPRHWPELSGVYRRLTDVVEVRRDAPDDANSACHSERKLSSRDGLLWGQLDAYFVSEAGIDLVDYKYGDIATEDGPRSEYEDQLYFYAYLIAEVHGTYPRSLSLLGRDGGVVRLTPSPERSSMIAREMRSLLRTYNDEVKRGRSFNDLATPTSEGCTFCDRKHLCDRFWSSIRTLSIPQWNHVAVGMQSKPLLRTGRGGGWFELHAEGCSFAAHTIRVTRVFAQRFPSIDLVHRVGQRLLVTGLREVGTAIPAIAEATERSEIICMESRLARPTE